MWQYILDIIDCPFYWFDEIRSKTLPRAWKCTNRHHLLARLIAWKIAEHQHAIAKHQRAIRDLRRAFQSANKHRKG